MVLIVDDTVLTKDEVGSKGPTNIIGDTVAITGELGTRGSNYIVGDTISVWDKNIGVKSSTFDKIHPTSHSWWFDGYGYYMWELVSMTKSATRTELGLHLIKRSMSSENLSIGDIKKIRDAEDDEVSFSGGVYTWNETIFGFNRGWEILATDNIIYLLSGGNLYKLNKINGSYTLLGSMPSADETRWFMTDGDYIYGYRAFETPRRYHLTKVKVSDFSIAADYSSAAEYPVGCYRQGDYLYVGFYSYPAHIKSFQKHNVSDMARVSSIAGGDDFTSSYWNGSLTSTNGSYSCVYWKDDIYVPIDYYTWILLNPVNATTKETIIENEFV